MFIAATQPIMLLMLLIFAHTYKYVIPSFKYFLHLHSFKFSIHLHFLCGLTYFHSFTKLKANKDSSSILQPFFLTVSNVKIFVPCFLTQLKLFWHGKNWLKEVEHSPFSKTSTYHKQQCHQNWKTRQCHSTCQPERFVNNGKSSAHLYVLAFDKLC